MKPGDLLSPLPEGWQLYLACDTGTYMSGCIAAVDPVYNAILFLEEFPNYRYVGGDIELLDVTTPQWADGIVRAYNKYRPGTHKVKGFVDQNSQFKEALKAYGLYLQSNLKPFELRVDISREYMQANNPPLIYMAPWLTVLPYEMEHAQWPKDTASATRFERLKINDHTLDCFEHICSRRPRRKLFKEQKQETFLERHLRVHRWTQTSDADPHLGRH